jgi:hypothetical protein
LHKKNGIFIHLWSGELKQELWGQLFFKPEILIVVDHDKNAGDMRGSKRKQ